MFFMIAHLEGATMGTEQQEIDDVINKKLRIMDATAFALCRDQKLPVQVIKITKSGALLSAVMGKEEGTFVFND